ncbi:MAG: hypothetical protein H6727_16700 [Myxococcales bacterium]|nr:hypothetical protein [Myxococcales bacterium]
MHKQETQNMHKQKAGQNPRQENKIAKDIQTKRLADTIKTKRMQEKKQKHTFTKIQPETILTEKILSSFCSPLNTKPIPLHPK